MSTATKQMLNTRTGELRTVQEGDVLPYKTSPYEWVEIDAAEPGADATFRRLAASFLDAAHKLSQRKAHDYDNGGIQITDYWRYGWRSLMTYIWNKTLRAESLLAGDKAPNFESLDDTVVDAINYWSFLGAWLRMERERK